VAAREAQTRGWRSAGFAATLCILTLKVALGATPASAIVVTIGGHTVGVTPIKGVSVERIPASHRTAGPLASQPSGPLNFDGLPQGGGPLLYNGGPVMHSVTTHVVYWDPKGEFTSTTKGIVAKFFGDVAHDSGQASNVFPVAGQYTDGTGHAAYGSTFAGALIDKAPYPPTGKCTVPTGLEVDPGPPYETCLFDSKVKERLSAFISAEKLATGITQQYFVLFPHKVVTCFNETVKEEEKFGKICSNNFFCAYHGSIGSPPNEIIYSDIPFSLLDSGNAKGCQDDGNGVIQLPNGDAGASDTETRFADVALKYTSHEYTEAATDPLGNGYVDAHGLENGDKCNGVSPDEKEDGIGYDANSFIPTLGGSVGAGTLFDQLISADSYYLQSEWDNAAKACTMRPVPITAAGFTSSATSGVAGTPITFTGAATDVYAGLSFLWKWGDGTESAGAAPSHVYGAPGSYEVTMIPTDELTYATAPPVVHTIVVDDPATASFSISPNPTGAGVPLAFNGSASNDPDGSISSYAWNFGDGGAGSGVAPSHTYAAPGGYTVTLTVTDSGGQTGTAAQTVTVGAAPQAKSSSVPPNSSFSQGEASFNQTTGVITFTATIGDPGTFSWLLTFQNGKFGVFAASNHKCKARFVRLSGTCHPSRIVFAKGSLAVAGAGPVTLKLKPSPSALKALKNALKQKKGLPVTITLTFQSVRGGSPVSHTRQLTVKMKKK
jgi:PKD repeat protein